MNNASFTCSICGEPSHTICNYCTHDACGNHVCVRCGRCSDCCICESHLNKDEFGVHALQHAELLLMTAEASGHQEATPPDHF